VALLLLARSRALIRLDRGAAIRRLARHAKAGDVATVLPRAVGWGALLDRTRALDPDDVMVLAQRSEAGECPDGKARELFDAEPA